jgi:hypothetical protein
MPAALAALIEAVGAEALLTIALFSTFAAYLVSRGLLVTWTSTFGKAFVWLADHLSFRLNLKFAHPHIDLGGPFRTVNNAIVNYFETWASNTEASMAWTWRAMGTVWRANVAAVEWASHELADSMEWLLKVRLPKWARAAFAVAFPAAYLAKLIASQVAKFAVHPLRTIKVIEHTVTHTVVRVVKSVGAVAIPGVVGLPKIRADIRNLWRWRTHAEKRLRKLEVAVGATAAAAILANALGVSKLCVRRGNLKKVARSVCGMRPDILADLLLGTTAIVGAISIVEFANAMRAIEDEAVTVAGKLIREWPS